jgi:hypothetical protein
MSYQVLSDLIKRKLHANLSSTSLLVTFHQPRERCLLWFAQNRTGVELLHRLILPGEQNIRVGTQSHKNLAVSKLFRHNLEMMSRPTDFLLSKNNRYFLLVKARICACHNSFSVAVLRGHIVC